MFAPSKSARWRTTCGIEIKCNPENYCAEMVRAASQCKFPVMTIRDILSCVYDIDAPWTWFIQNVMESTYQIKDFQDEAFCKTFAEWIVSVINEAETILVTATGKNLNIGGF